MTGAIGYLKEAIRTWKGIKSPEAVFVAACKEGRKPGSAQIKSAVKDWFEWARKQRIVIAMSGETVFTPEGEAVAVAEMMRRCPVGGKTIVRCDHYTFKGAARYERYKVIS